MVAATKMRRAQMKALSGRPYNEFLNNSLYKLLNQTGKTTHPLLAAETTGETAVMLLSTDKSLCGSLNTNLFRETFNFIKTNETLSFFTIGKKARNLIAKLNLKLSADFENLELPEFSKTAQIARMLISSFLKGELKEVYIMYPHFVSTLRQDPTTFRLLPIENFQKLETDLNTNEREYLLEPNANDLLEYMLVHLVEMKLYQAMLETKASEHSARMIAMQNATDNAKELVSDLQLAYNQTRQGSITKELLEITSAVAALE